MGRPARRGMLPPGCGQAGRREAPLAATWASLVRFAARGDVFHVIDTETTGQAPPGSRVIEVACISYVQGRPLDRFETLIDPGVPIPPFITRLTGISPGMVVGQPASAEAIARFAAYLAARPGHFVAHNAAFDERFLRHEFACAGQPWPFTGRWCTVRLSRHCLPDLPRHNLDALIRHFGLAHGPRHRAMGDVEATGQAFWRLVASLAPDGPEVAVEAPGQGAPWPRLLAWLEGHSRPLAALLTQHGRPSGPDADGPLVVSLGAPLMRHVSPDRLALLEAGVHAVFGPHVGVRLEPVSGGPGSAG
ncbi:MAG: 3'-5' exonuclease [Candidatus Sericytochromatia bacterium]|nr:3'-5' exonuclease [Candidatus Sericytochromatia bacterium]